MAMLSLENIIDFEFRQQDLWTIQLFNIGKKNSSGTFNYFPSIQEDSEEEILWAYLPAINVDYKLMELHHELRDVGPGIPIHIYSGHKFVRQVDVTIAESDALHFQRELISWCMQVVPRTYATMSLGAQLALAKKMVIKEYSHSRSTKKFKPSDKELPVKEPLKDFHKDKKRTLFDGSKSDYSQPVKIDEKTKRPVVVPKTKDGLSDHESFVLDTPISTHTFWVLPGADGMNKSLSSTQGLVTYNYSFNVVGMEFEYVPGEYDTAKFEGDLKDFAKEATSDVSKDGNKRATFKSSSEVGEEKEDDSSNNVAGGNK